LIYLEIGLLYETIWDMRTAPATVAAAYRKWMRRLPWRESISRAFDLPIIPKDPFNDPEIPRDIEVRFVPLAIMREPEDTKEIRRDARKDPLQFMAIRFLGLNPGIDDRVAGLVLESDSEARAGQQKVWYNVESIYRLGSSRRLVYQRRRG
jgi:hypothetical protein